MPIVTGGWTVDGGVIEVLDRSGYATILFYCFILEAVKQKFATIEVAGTLSTAEIGLRSAISNINPFQINGAMPGVSNADLDRILQFIRKNPKWTAKGLYMPFADIETCIDGQWVNILKKWS